MSTPNSGPRVVVEPFDSSVLISIWLDGFVSGVASLARHTNATDAEADKWADDMAAALRADRAAMETVRNEVSERLRGIESEAHNLDVHVAPKNTGGDTHG